MSEETDMIDSTKENINWIKLIKGNEEYLITNNGAVWSTKENRWLKPYKDEDGHIKIDLGFIHRLVYQHFIGSIPKDYIIHHIDECPYNNLYTNLKAMTNAEHASLHHTGKVPWNKGKKIGPRSQQAKAKEKATKMKNGTWRKKLSQQHKRKIGEGRKGKKHSEETKQKMKDAWTKRKQKFD